MASVFLIWARGTEGAYHTGMRYLIIQIGSGVLLLAMGLTAFLCIAIGVYPAPLYALLPYDVDYVPYTTFHVVTQLQLLFFSALAFTVLMLTRIYPPEMKSVNLDFDWTYRRFLPSVISRVSGAVSAFWSAKLRFWQRRLDGIVSRLFRRYGPEGQVAQSAPTGSMVLWIAVFLGVTLVVNFIS